MNKKKLLHISLGCHNTEMWNSFDRHFITRHFDWTAYRNNELLNRDILEIFNSFKPDVVFMQLHGDSVFTSTLKQMNDSRITALWNRHLRHPIPNHEIEFGKNVDISLHVNTHYVDELSRKGVNSQYLNVGFDENIFTPNGDKGNYQPIIFLGSNYHLTSGFPLSSYREQMARTLTQRYGRNGFMAYGNNWLSYIGQERYLNMQEEAQAYRSALISINLSHFNYGRYSSDRMLRLMGSGGFCLSHHYKDIELDFKVGEHLDTWHSIEELMVKIDFYLNNDELREKIRKHGCEYVRNTFTWNHFVIELKKIIGI